MSKRSVLLPPYLDGNPIWTDLVEAIDQLWASGTISQVGVDSAINALRYIRYPYVLSDTALDKIAKDQMLNFADFTQPDRSLLIQQTNLLGLPFTNSDLLSDADYLRIFRNLGLYWYSKGKSNFIDFLSFCLNTAFEITNLWTQDYVNFYEEGDALIGTPVWSGGTWYPTTHVRLSYDATKYSQVPNDQLARLFYDFANYNLVLLSIDKVASPLIVADDSSLWVSGLNSYGVLGSGDTVARSSPVQVGIFTQWEQISGESSSVHAVMGDGTLWTWGNNSYGNLGIGDDTTNKSSPVQVGSLTDWKQVSKGSNFTLAVKKDGTLWSWGYNANGQLGTSDRVYRSSPVQVGILTTWASVSAGSNFSLAIKQDGTLWGWGYGLNGQLGMSALTYLSSPVQIGSLATWATVAAGSNFTAAIQSDGTLWTWGTNNAYQLGLGNTTARSSPVQVGTSSNWAQVSCGTNSSVAVTTTGQLWTWGGNTSGECGLGHRVNVVVPTQVGTNLWLNASIKFSAMGAVGKDNTLWTWGSNTAGRLGLGDTADRSSPVQVGSLDTWKSVTMANSMYALNANIDLTAAHIVILGGIAEVEDFIGSTT